MENANIFYGFHDLTLYAHLAHGEHVRLVDRNSLGLAFQRRFRVLSVKHRVKHLHLGHVFPSSEVVGVTPTLGALNRAYETVNPNLALHVVSRPENVVSPRRTHHELLLKLGSILVLVPLWVEFHELHVEQLRKKDVLCCVVNILLVVAVFDRLFKSHFAKFEVYAAKDGEKLVFQHARYLWLLVKLAICNRGLLAEGHRHEAPHTLLEVLNV